MPFSTLVFSLSPSFSRHLYSIVKYLNGSGSLLGRLNAAPEKYQEALPPST